MIPKQLFLCAVAASLILVAASSAQAANHYILPNAAGSGNGNDWLNAFGGIPSTLVRGDTYYIAGGSYGIHRFSQAASATYVYLKKANAADNSGVAGWQSSFATAQAVFTATGSATVFDIEMNNLSIDGVTGSGTSGHGIKLETTGTGDLGTGSGYCIQSISTAPDGLILKHLECAAPLNNQGLNMSKPLVSNSVWGTGDNSLFQYLYVHGGLVSVLVDGHNQIIDHCYLQNAGGQQHSEIINAANVQNLTVRYCVLENLIGPNGTTYVEPQVNGGTVPNGIYIYGNVFKATSSTDQENNPSVFSSTSGEQVLNVFIYNNTFYGLRPNPAGFQDSGIRGDNSASTITVQNNVWQACTYAPSFQSVQVQDHNVLNTGAISFVNAAAGDFHLTVNTSAGVNLGSPYNVDPDGRTRTTWSLGAYEFSGAGSTPIPTVTPIPSPTPTATTPPAQTPTPTPIPGGSPIEGESGTISAPFTISGGYISQSVTTGLTGSGRAAYSITLASDGDYVIQAFVNGSSLTSNSFYLNIDAEPQDPVMEWDILPPTAGFENRFVSWRGSGTADADEFVPKIFHLTSGTHQVILRGREADTQLDRFTILKLPAPPQGLQVVPGP